MRRRQRPGAGPWWRRRRKVAFVLSGGGNLGAVQVGMLRALAERGITADLVVGASVGALNGAAYAAEPTPVGVERLAQTWLGLRGKDDVMPPDSWLPMTAKLIRKGGATHRNDGLRRVIDSVLGPISDFEALRVPFGCVATAVDDAREVWFDQGPLLKEAVLASAALPAVYPAVEIEGVRYIDGAVVNDVPISRALELGAREIWVLTVGTLDRPRPEPKRPLDLAIQAYWIARRHRYERDLASVPDKVALHVLPTGDPPAIRFNDFTKTGALMESSYLASLAHLDALAGVPHMPPVPVGLAEPPVSPAAPAATEVLAPPVPDPVPAEPSAPPAPAGEASS